MSDLIWLSDAQMRRIERHFPRSHGVPRVDDRRIVSGDLLPESWTTDGWKILI
jgi:transposase